MSLILFESEASPIVRLGRINEASSSKHPLLWRETSGLITQPTVVLRTGMDDPVLSWVLS